MIRLSKLPVTTDIGLVLVTEKIVLQLIINLKPGKSPCPYMYLHGCAILRGSYFRIAHSDFKYHFPKFSPLEIGKTLQPAVYLSMKREMSCLIRSDQNSS